MKVILTCTAIFGVMCISTAGCGSNGNPLEVESPEPASEPPIPTFTPTPNVTPILGTWLLQQSTHRINDDIKFHDYGDMPWAYLTFKQNRTFEAIFIWQIQEVTSMFYLAWKGLQHIEEISITFRGEYQIGVNQSGADQLWLDLLTAEVKPKEAPEIDSDFENPIFYLVGNVGATRLWNYSSAEDGSQLELGFRDGQLSVAYDYRRIKIR